MLAPAARGPDAGTLLIYFHGGGYLWMNPVGCSCVMAALARECDAQCLGVDYRRAPGRTLPSRAFQQMTHRIGSSTGPACA